MLDKSGSMYPYKDELRQFTLSVLRQFVLSTGSTALGVVDFNSQAYVVSELHLRIKKHKLGAAIKHDKKQLVKSMPQSVVAMRKQKRSVCRRFSIASMNCL